MSRAALGVVGLLTVVPPRWQRPSSKVQWPRDRSGSDRQENHRVATRRSEP